MKLDSIKRIIREDYPKEDRQTIEKLAGILNPFLEQIAQAFDQQIDFNNLAQEIKTFNVKIEANGVPIEGKKVKLSQNGRVMGVSCINARNLDNITLYPTNQPFISQATTNKIMNISNITGLQANVKYELTIILYYDIE